MPFKITILGSSGAVPAYGRFPSSQFIEIKNHYFLIDCGEGAQMQMTRFDLGLHRLDHIFISHLHGDHYLGLMGLLFTLHLNRRAADLHLYSHRGLDEIIITQLRYSKSALNFKIVFHTLTPGEQEIIFEDKHLSVETIPLSHKLDCSGFLIREKPKQRRIDKESLPPGLLIRQILDLKEGGDVIDQETGKVLYRNRDLTLPARASRSYAYCSDTQYDESLISRLQNIDVLYHEATFISEDESKAIETLHSTARQAALIAQRAQVKKLLIGHFSARYKDLSTLHQEATAIFPNTYLAQEGETFVIQE
ncbi:MAG TPA: ribonuclease Z [Cyclobacteriaceae bacterium]|nr:ribonuclease Z [Cyclobacteriaceae bacterium]